MQRGMVLRKLCQILIDIKDNGDANDQRNGKDISTDKLLDDVPVYSLNVTEWIDKSQKLQFPSNPLAYALQQPGMGGCPPEKPMKPCRMPRQPAHHLKVAPVIAYLLKTSHAIFSIQVDLLCHVSMPRSHLAVYAYAHRRPAGGRKQGYGCWLFAWQATLPP